MGIEETLTMIVENFKIREIIMIKEIIKINATIMKSVIMLKKENINMKRAISKKEIGKIMIISVLMMTINHLTNRNKMEREDSLSEILKMTHHKEITNISNKGEEVTM